MLSTFAATFKAKHRCVSPRSQATVVRCYNAEATYRICQW
jgi:hypothetical protein